MLVFLLFLAMLPTLASAVGNAIRRDPVPLPGLTERESADFLFLDWLMSAGLYDAGLARRYAALAADIDFALDHELVDDRSRAALSAVRCIGCGGVWGTGEPGCRRCTWPDGTPLPLEWRVPSRPAA